MVADNEVLGAVSNAPADRTNVGVVDVIALTVRDTWAVTTGAPPGPVPVTVMVDVPLGVDVEGVTVKAVDWPDVIV